MARILVVDDEQSMREFLEILLRKAGHEVRLAEDAPAAVQALGTFRPDLVITDLRLKVGTGLEVLAATRRALPQTQTLMVTAFATAENAVTAMKMGAFHYLIKPFKVDELTVQVERALEVRGLKQENQALKEHLLGRSAQAQLLGESPQLQTVQDLIDKVAGTRTTVLVCGESGTGKELVARAIHLRGPRADAPFLVFHCGAVPEGLLESELFGHVKGAFTGAVQAKAGIFEAARGGTVFLDEIGELPVSVQVKLLRVLQEKVVHRVGGQGGLEVDARVIAATHRDLQKRVAVGQFREDLWYRLNVIQITVPPLRERRGDIPPLARAFAQRFNAEQGAAVTGISDAAMELLCRYDYPGNVRELQNVIERGVTLSEGPLLEPMVLPDHLRGARSTPPSPASGQPEVPEAGLDLVALVENYERSLLESALRRSGGRKKKAAELLKLSFRSFRYRAQKLGLGGTQADDDEDT
ncbi:MAG: sigma-54-dependent Fis family transcriptional regulator [Deltaproteobacteria bacterium]|nr:sigma-54-dependent Fis family transcriptional regulator [Deltaproteobacteria bacterium]